jgi:hypothetical protein
MRALALLVLAYALAATLLACPPDDKKGSAPAPTPALTGACQKVGQSCEFSPGKLGTCVSKDDCSAPPCFICQSQH